MLEVTCSQTNGNSVPVTIMHLKGSFDSEGAGEFDKSAEEIVAGSVKNVLIDLTDVSFMSSVGVRSIHRLFYDLHPRDSIEFRRVLDEGIQRGTYKAPHLKLLNPNSRVLQLLKTISADMYLDILAGSEMEAIKAFG